MLKTSNQKTQEDECESCGTFSDEDKCEFCQNYKEVFSSIPQMFRYEDDWEYPLADGD